IVNKTSPLSFSLTFPSYLPRIRAGLAFRLTLAQSACSFVMLLYRAFVVQKRVMHPCVLFKLSIEQLSPLNRIHHHFMCF
ncbi:MAG: hypothetical protein ACK55Z_13885, partial [bacterium]